MTKPDNPNAFPQTATSIGEMPEYEHMRGMTLRDYFAGQALMGMLAHGTRYKPRDGDPENWHEAIAKEAGELADAMLAEREELQRLRNLTKNEAGT